MSRPSSAPRVFRVKISSVGCFRTGLIVFYLRKYPVNLRQKHKSYLYMNSIVLL